MITDYCLHCRVSCSTDCDVQYTGRLQQCSSETAHCVVRRLPSTEKLPDVRPSVCLSVCLSVERTPLLRVCSRYRLVIAALHSASSVTSTLDLLAVLSTDLSSLLSLDVK